MCLFYGSWNMDAVYFTCWPSLLQHLLDYHWQRRRKSTEKQLAGFLARDTTTRATDMSANTGKSTLSSHKHANKHSISIHKQNHWHWGRERPCIPWPGCVYLKTRESCECSQLQLLCMYVRARKTLLTAVCHFDCPAWLLSPKPPNTPIL